MHLIPRRRMRRVLVLLIAMSGLLAVPALAFAHSDLSLVKVVDHAQAAPGDLLTYTIVIQNHGTHANAPGHGDRHAAAAHDVRERHERLRRGRRRHHVPGRAARRRPAPSRSRSPCASTTTCRPATLLNIADVTAPGDTPTDNNHGEAITTVDLRRPRRLRLVGSEPRRPAGRRRAGPRRRHGAPLRRLRRARRHDDDRRQRLLPLRPTATGDDLRRLPRHRPTALPAARSRASS